MSKELLEANARIEQLESVLYDLAFDVDMLGAALFGDCQAWRQAKAHWWVNLVESYNRAQEVLGEEYGQST